MLLEMIQILALVEFLLKFLKQVWKYLLPQNEAIFFFFQ